MLPNFIGIGVPKAGTTWLANCLSEHPQIFMAAAKETSFFRYADPDGRRSEYEAHFSGSERAVAIGEFTTSYLESDRPPAAIRRIIPDARLLVSLRNPIDQVYSHYWHVARQNFHRGRDGGITCTFEDAMDRYSELLFGPARYCRHLTRWLKHFPRSQLLIVFYDDIRRRPAEVLRDVYKFLEVDPDFSAPSIGASGAAVRRGVSPRSLLLGRVHAELYERMNRWAYRPLKQWLGVRRAAHLKDVLCIRQMMEAAFFRPGYPPMQPATRARVAERFAEEIAGIAELTGADLSHWN